MQEEREDGKPEEQQPKRKRIRSREITADFTRVEDIGTMPAMAPFELEARKKIAERSTNPLDGLIAAEEKQKRMAEVRRGNRALNVLIKEGALTPRQALVYGLCYGKKLRENEVPTFWGLLQERSRGFARKRGKPLSAVWRNGGAGWLTSKKPRPTDSPGNRRKSSNFDIARDSPSKRSPRCLGGRKGACSGSFRER